jgi:TolA-binding protein
MHPMPLFRVAEMYYELNNLTLAKDYYELLTTEYPDSVDAGKAKVRGPRLRSRETKRPGMSRRCILS